MRDQPAKLFRGSSDLLRIGSMFLAVAILVDVQRENHEPFDLVIGGAAGQNAQQARAAILIPYFKLAGVGRFEKLPEDPLDISAVRDIGFQFALCHASPINPTRIYPITSAQE